MKAQEIRKSYLDFFASKGHKIQPSASLVPQDPTLLFTAAGMVPFKDYFLGVKKDMTRAASCQLCMRTTDIDRVGATKRHLTFFEMLGNFSFGNYFKAEAVEWAWEFLTKNMGLPKDRLWVTIYKDDNEAEALWKKTAPGVPVTRLSEETNFWTMGPTGPCGPSSEIFWDFGKEKGCAGKDCDPSCDNCERFLEIWNLVFTQFDRQENGDLKPLAKPNIDTGMGLERLALVLQGKNSAFDTDLFFDPKTLFDMGLLSEEALKLGTAGREYRVIADHARSSTFLAASGVFPENVGRGYILRRLIRRAVRSSVKREPFLHKLSAQLMAMPVFGQYKELFAKPDLVTGVIKAEEEKFLETLEKGETFLKEVISQAQASGKKIVSGEKVFHLYETYGYPVELSAELLKERGLSIDEAGVEKAREEHQKVSSVWKGSGAKAVTNYAAVKQKLYLPETPFTGYDDLNAASMILALLDPEGNPVKEAKEGQDVQIILAKTPFYPEGGGQVGDQGEIRSQNGTAEVHDTQTPLEGLIVHHAKVTQGILRQDDPAQAQVTSSFRKQSARHHSATHLLHWALRKILGGHVTQAGSHVGPEKFRLDFTHSSSLKGQALGDIEGLVNETIQADFKRERKEMTLEEAKKTGAMMLFGEKYGAKVYVVKFGESCETCGGTHVQSTRDIGEFKVIKESSVASGVRRIEAATGDALKAILESRPQPQQAQPKKEKSKASGPLKDGEMIEGAAKDVPYRIYLFPEGEMGQLRAFSDGVRKEFNGLFMIAAKNDGKSAFVVGVSPQFAGKVKADALAKDLAKEMGGSAGGRSDFAQGALQAHPTRESAVQALKKILS